MKILAVSLLRLGDIIQQVPLLQGLRQQYPEAQIHILLNRQFTQAEVLLGGLVDRFIYFDREALQRGLGEASYNFMWSYTQLENLVSQISAEGYDKIYNFTHTRMSAYIIGAVEGSAQKLGLYQGEGRFRGLDQPWLRYFNDRFADRGRSLFHYVELLGNAFDIPVAKTKLRPVQKKTKRVLFQCLTSDMKKNWGLENFKALKQTIEKNLVDYRVQVLGAPFEREKLRDVFNEEDLLIRDLKETRDLFKDYDLLVTGDTSIKHLAAQEGMPIVEICLGGSDSNKTGAFVEKAEIIKANVPCAPCVHSKACTQSSHRCAENISIDQVFAAVWRRLSQESIEKVDLNKELDRSVFASYLNQRRENSLNALRSQIVPSDIQSMTHGTAELQLILKRIERALPTQSQMEQMKSLSSLEVSELVLCGQDILASGKDQGGYFQAYIEALTQKYSLPIQVYNRVTQALDEARELLRLRESFVQELTQPLSMEGEYYAKGIGQLSIRGFEEARAGLQRDHQDADL